MSDIDYRKLFYCVYLKCFVHHQKVIITQSLILIASLPFQENSARFLTERGQNVNGQPNIIYVSTDNGGTWIPLHEFVDVSFTSPVIYHIHFT